MYQHINYTYYQSYQPCTLPGSRTDATGLTEVPPNCTWTALLQGPHAMQYTGIVTDVVSYVMDTYYY